MADIQLEHTAAEIDYAIAALRADTTGPTHPSSEVTTLSGTETIPLKLPAGQPVFITYANLLADVVAETTMMDEIAEQARDAIYASLVAGATGDDGITVTANDGANTITIKVDTLDGGVY